MPAQRGQTIIIVIIFISVFLTIGATLFAQSNNTRQIVQRQAVLEKARNIAEAGIAKATWCLNNPTECSSPYTGETTTFDNGQFSTTLTSVGLSYRIVSTGTYLSVTKVVTEEITQQSVSSGASFFYGVQVGAGGLDMANNSYVNGNVYSNGSITAGNGAYVTGDVYVAGGTALATNQEQTTTTSDFPFGQASPNPSDIAQSFKTNISEVVNKVSLYLKKVGSPGNATVHIYSDNSGNPGTSLTSGTLSASLVTTSYGWVDVTFNTNPQLTAGTTYWVIVDGGSRNDRYYISGKTTDTAYTNGTGKSSTNLSSWTSASGDFTFKIWLGGIVTSINGLQIGDKGHTCDNGHYATHHGNAYAHRILNSWVECDAFFTADPGDITGTTVGRTKHANSTDPAPENMPVSDGQITEWKSIAEAGGTITGDYTLTNFATATLGPTKITGNMLIDNGAQLTIRGTIWVSGTITLSNGAVISLDPGYGATSGIVVADGKINVNNNCVFNGSGTSGSYIMFLTTSSTLDNDIIISNNAETVIFYAGNGMINVSNNAALKEATAYKLYLSNGSTVSYESGLANASFANGPGGIWTTSKTNWLEL
ncbi:MAG: hypothetical protein HZC01_05295 [Candidatus Kerfeldbacteria bacterium]|nr:hypothetical protein [Candidatus Kerfeldbacteria bacterium]